MNLKQLFPLFLVFMFFTCCLTAFNINRVSKIYNTADVFVTLKADDGTTIIDTVNASSNEFLLLGDNMVYEVVDGGIKQKKVFGNYEVVQIRNSEVRIATNEIVQINTIAFVVEILLFLTLLGVRIFWL